MNDDNASWTSVVDVSNQPKHDCGHRPHSEVRKFAFLPGMLVRLIENMGIGSQMKLLTSCIAAVLLAPTLSQADCSNDASHLLSYSDEVVAVRDHFFTSMCGADKGELFDFLDPSLNGRIVAPKKMHSTHKGNYYPDSARRQHHEGTTIAAYVVDINGNVADVSVINSSGYAELDQATVNAIKSFHFEQPAELDGRAVRVILYFPFKWHLTYV